MIGRTLRVLLQKELKQVGRDRFMVAQLLLMPMVQLILLGNAATFEVKQARMFVVDQDHSQMSREIVQKLQGTGRFVLVGSSVSMKPANDAILSRDAGMILGIPTGFESDVVNTGTGHVQLILNAEDGAAAGVTQSYVARIISDYARGVAVELKPDVPAVNAIDVRGRGWFNPELDYRPLHGAGDSRSAHHRCRHAHDGDEHRSRKGNRNSRAAERHSAFARSVHRSEAACRWSPLLSLS